MALGFRAGAAWVQALVRARPAGGGNAARWLGRRPQDPPGRAPTPGWCRRAGGGPPGVGRLNHVAVAVPDLERSAEHYRTVLGAKVSAPQAVPAHGVTVVFIELENTKIELLHPLGADSPIRKFLEKNPAGGIHHICLEVDDVRESMAHVSSYARLLSDEPKIGAHGNPVVFLHPKDCDGVLTELEQAG